MEQILERKITYDMLGGILPNQTQQNFPKTNRIRKCFDNKPKVPSKRKEEPTFLCSLLTTPPQNQPSNPPSPRTIQKKQNKIVALQASCLQLHKHTPQIF